MTDWPELKLHRFCADAVRSLGITPDNARYLELMDVAQKRIEEISPETDARIIVSVLRHAVSVRFNQIMAAETLEGLK